PGRPKEGAGVRPPTEEVVAAMVSAALGHIHILESLDYNLIKVSMKASDPPTMIAANRAIADKISYPLQLGVTEAGPPRTGAVTGRTPASAAHAVPAWPTSADVPRAGGPSTPRTLRRRSFADWTPSPAKTSNSSRPRSGDTTR